MRGLISPPWLFICVNLPFAFSHSDGRIQAEDRLEELESKWGIDWGFSGISTFAHLSHVRCLSRPDENFDIGIIGAPFDTATSYRPGARFGPRAIRAATGRQTSFRGYNARAKINPYKSWAKIIDCGDIPTTPFDNALALKQLSEGFLELGRRSATEASLASFSTFRQKPKLLTLGGDHSIALPALRALEKLYGKPIAVVHFDAHLDTWLPNKYPSYWIGEGRSPSDFNHGSMFWLAGQEGLIKNGSSIHAGLRTRLAGVDEDDFVDDGNQGWARISTDDIDTMGTSGIVQAILDRVGTDYPVYLSVDIDVIDPGMAPGTGTPEPGGWTTRELIRILRGIETLNLVGADIVEVSPAYDGNGEATALAAAQIGFEILSSMVKKGLMEMGKTHEMTGTASGKDEL